MEFCNVYHLCTHTLYAATVTLKGSLSVYTLRLNSSLLLCVARKSCKYLKFGSILLLETYFCDDTFMAAKAINTEWPWNYSTKANKQSFVDRLKLTKNITLDAKCMQDTPTLRLLAKQILNTLWED